MTPAGPDFDAVSAREREVLALLGEQLTHDEIGRRLFISARTVESHVASLRRKLDLPDHRSLVRLAVERRTDVVRSSGPPAPLTSFVGRSAELAELAAAVESTRLVSLVGPGGAGKTRLALAACSALTRKFEHGVAWVDLVAAGDADALADSVTRACGVVASSRLAPVDALVAGLRGRHLLVVLDNCEHLVNAVAVLAERLLAGCPDLTILVTSRLRLAVSFEHVVTIGGLSTGSGGEAVELFLERAASAGTAVSTHADHERIGAVCEALGGLPLALELAAVRLPALGLDGLQRGLLDQPGLLRGGERATARHRSIGDALGWSVALLPAPAATTLRRIAVLVTPFGDDDAIAVAAFGELAAPDLGPALEVLVEHNLVIATDAVGGRRYRILEPVRQFAVATMADVDKAAFEHHLSWCRRTATDLLAAASYDDVSTIADNARAALDWAGASTNNREAASELAADLGLLLFGSGHLREAQLRLEQAAASTSDGNAAARHLSAAAAVAKCRVRGEDALRLETTAAEHARSANDPVGAALALARSAELLTRFRGMFSSSALPGAEPFLREAAALAPEDRTVAVALEVARASYGSSVAGPNAEQAAAAVATARALAEPVLESAALDALIGAALFRLDIPTAHRLAEDRVAALRQWDVRDPATALEVKDALHVATFCALGIGELDRALAHADALRALPFLRQSPDVADDEVMAPAVLAGDLEAAIAAGERFLAEWDAAGRPPAVGRAIAPTAVALAHGLRGDYVGRQRWLEIVAEIRGVPVADASRGTGYGEAFEAMVLLHQDRAAEAFEVLTAPGDRGLYGRVFHQWTVALAADAAVRAGRADAAERIADARAQVAGNPVAGAMVERAAAAMR